MKQFETNVATILKFLKDENFSSSEISAHKVCYKELHSFLVDAGKVYSS